MSQGPQSHMPKSAWILTDGKAGDVAQCLGVVEALGCDFESRIVAPRAPYAWWLPFGPIDPMEKETEPNSPIAPPFPDIVIASGRRAAAYLKRIKKLSNKKTFTVFLKDPRIGTKAADLIWAPEHDSLRGKNVFTTTTSPHLFSAQKLEGLRKERSSNIDSLSGPRIAAFIGGNSRHHTFTSQDQDKIVNALEDLAASQSASLMITTSRRTPIELIKKLRSFDQPGKHLFWAGEGDNPYASFLAKADAFVVTADSTNMVSEAAATGKTIHVFNPSGGHKKINRFLDSLAQQGVTAPFPGTLKMITYKPVDATPLIADRIVSDYTAHINEHT